MKDEILSNVVQEYLLSLLVFDDKAIPLIASNVKINLFESFIFRDIATEAISFYNQFKKPVGIHLDDIILKDKDTKVKPLYEEVLNKLKEHIKSINRDYILSLLGKFIRTQTLKTNILKAAELVEKEEIDEAELVLNNCKAKQTEIFDSGIKFWNYNELSNIFETTENHIHCGIKELDSIEACPAPKELLTFVALSSHGKTWFMTHLAKFAMLQRKNVVHISLEMSEERLAIRYVQSLFSVAKNNELCSSPFFKKDEYGGLDDLKFDNIKPDLTLHNPNITKIVKERLSKLKKKTLIVKEFPTSTLTIIQLKAYLENLISLCSFVPDLILVDDPDNMKLDSNNLRIEIGNMYKQLRGIAIEYNCAMVAVSQINRAGATARWINEKYLSEDFSKLFTSDILISYNQTQYEYEHGLARLLVIKNRNQRKGDKILISQNYNIGQFCIDSVKLGRNYWNIIGEGNEE